MRLWSLSVMAECSRKWHLSSGKGFGREGAVNYAMRPMDRGMIKAPTPSQAARPMRPARPPNPLGTRITTVTPQDHHRDPGDHRNTTGESCGDREGARITTGTPPGHHPDTTGKSTRDPARVWALTLGLGRALACPVPNVASMSKPRTPNLEHVPNDWTSASDNACLTPFPVQPLAGRSSNGAHECRRDCAIGPERLYLAFAPVGARQPSPKRHRHPMHRTPSYPPRTHPFLRALVCPHPRDCASIRVPNAALVARAAAKLHPPQACATGPLSR